MYDLLEECGEWNHILRKEIRKPYFKALSKLIIEKRDVITPKYKNIFRALKLVQPDDAVVCILGQDPYPTFGDANGLAFAVNKNVPYPPSLRNILREVETDTGRIPKSRTLIPWAKQGVVLLNTALTTEIGYRGAHIDAGWKFFTERVIKELNSNNCLFMCWGAHAIGYVNVINNKHMLCASHPSPLSAHVGFFGCKHFSNVNRRLKKLKKRQIDW